VLPPTPTPPHPAYTGHVSARVQDCVRCSAAVGVMWTGWWVSPFVQMVRDEVSKTWVQLQDILLLKATQGVEVFVLLYVCGTARTAVPCLGLVCTRVSCARVCHAHACVMRTRVSCARVCHAHACVMCTRVYARVRVCVAPLGVRPCVCARVCAWLRMWGAGRYRELSSVLPDLRSQEVKQCFTRLHPNIRVIRHPNHVSMLNRSESALYWSHHEKLVVVDQAVAIVGGLDLCPGRFDTPGHPLYGDCDTVVPREDFYNPRAKRVLAKGCV
jgi:hypothetical protein